MPCFQFLNFFYITTTKVSLWTEVEEGKGRESLRVEISGNFHTAGSLFFIISLKAKSKYLFWFISKIKYNFRPQYFSDVGIALILNYILNSGRKIFLCKSSGCAYENIILPTGVLKTLQAVRWKTNGLRSSFYCIFLYWKVFCVFFGNWKGIFIGTMLSVILEKGKWMSTRVIPDKYLL